VCNILVPCCDTAGFSTDAASCQKQFMTECQNDILKQPAGTTYDAKSAGVCLAAIGASVQNCAEKKDASLASSQKSCDHIFVGSTPVGGSCGSSSECAPPANGSVTCLHTGGSATGVCTVTTEVPAGEACGTSATVTCASDAHCKFDPSSSKMTCVPRAAVGQACDPLDFESCQDGLTCDTSKTCAMPHAIGEACNSVGLSPCNTSGFCDSTTNTCLAKKANGESCTTSGQCQSGRCHSNVCAVDTIATADICDTTSPPPSAGDAGTP
jgi:hypothetical protein